MGSVVGDNNGGKRENTHTHNHRNKLAFVDFFFF
jgi:hypothetical protein